MRVKYPRTLHLPWSEGVTSDDKVGDTSCFEGEYVVITEKRDGENTTIYSDGYCHARSIDSRGHPSRDYVKALAARLRGCGYRVCGENLYAKHSLGYTDLKDYFEVFSVWDGDRCLSWTDTMLFCEQWGLVHVPVICMGWWSEDLIQQAVRVDPEVQEGYVIRPIQEFTLPDFPLRKYVRKGHVQTDEHWMFKEVERNELV